MDDHAQALLDQAKLIVPRIKEAVDEATDSRAVALVALVGVYTSYFKELSLEEQREVLRTVRDVDALLDRLSLQ